jgi:hypothetical protein
MASSIEASACPKYPIDHCRGRLKSITWKSSFFFEAIKFFSLATDARSHLSLPVVEVRGKPLLQIGHSPP